MLNTILKTAPPGISPPGDSPPLGSVGGHKHTKNNFIIHTHSRQVQTAGCAYFKSVRSLRLYFSFTFFLIAGIAVAQTSTSVTSDKTYSYGIIDKAWAEGPKVYYFPIDKTDLREGYRSNGIMLRALDVLLSDEDVACCIDSVIVTAAASPIASRSHNDRLARARAGVLKDYIIRRYAAINTDDVYDYPMGIDWEGFWYIVENSKDLPHRDQVLATQTVDEEERLLLLRTTGGRDTYDYLLNKIYPQLQYASVRVVLNDGRSIPPIGSPLIRQERDTIYIDRVTTDTLYVDRLRIDTICPPKERKPFYLAVKTNLVYDAALLPNLAIEIPFGKNYDWSVAIDGNWSWWNTNASTYYYHRIQIAGLELRRWFGNTTGNPLNGWFVGAYGYGGTYDIRLFTDNNKDKGQLSNWTYSGGLNVGYSMPIAKRFNLEFNLGLGYIGGKYYKYNVCECTGSDCLFPKRSTHHRHYVGPTKIGVSLVWLIGSGWNDGKGKEAKR